MYFDGNTEGTRRYHPVRKVRSSVLIVQGAKDSALPSGVARTVADAVRERSAAPVIYAELPDTQHSFDLFASVRARAAANAIEAFLGWARSQRAAAPRR